MSNIYGRQVVVPMTNKSGGAVAAGDVVIYDSTTNESFTTTTSAASTLVAGIAQETIANNASGRVLTAGYAALVNVNASVTRLDFGGTHTVAKQAASLGSARLAGAFCRFLTTSATPSAYVYPVDLAGAALTNPMSTSQDIIVGGASGVPARLAVGAAGAALSVINSAVAWNAGTSFPGSKATNDRYYRTDLGLECYWDGTRWLTLNEYTTTFTIRDAVEPFTTSPAAFGSAPADKSQSAMWITRITAVTFVSTTNDGTKFWTFQLNSYSATVVATAIGSTFSTAADTASRYTYHGLAIGALFTAADTYLELTATKTSTPGSLFGSAQLMYRLVVV